MYTMTTMNRWSGTSRPHTICVLTKHASPSAMLPSRLKVNFWRTLIYSTRRNRQIPKCQLIPCWASPMAVDLAMMMMTGVEITGIPSITRIRRSRELSLRMKKESTTVITSLPSMLKNSPRALIGGVAVVGVEELIEVIVVEVEVVVAGDVEVMIKR